MSPFVVAALLWVVAAHVVAMIPSRDYHWRAAYGLMAVGAPIVVGLAVQAGVAWAGLFVAAGAWILRWPVYFFSRWLVGLVRG